MYLSPYPSYMYGYPGTVYSQPALFAAGNPYRGNDYISAGYHWHHPAAHAYERHALTLEDYGAQPFVVGIEEAAVQNETFRTALWTGDHLQVTLMSIPPGEDIGLEIHPDTDQFLRIEEGQGLVQMGEGEGQLDFQKEAHEDDAIMIPAGTWHNVTNTGSGPLKLYSIYAPPHHPFGTVHETKEEALEEE